MKGAHPSGYVTARELRVWQLVALGHKNASIAHELSVSPKTIEKHRTHLCRKLRVHNQVDLTRKAIERGVIHVRVRPLERRQVDRHIRFFL